MLRGKFHRDSHLLNVLAAMETGSVENMPVIAQLTMKNTKYLTLRNTF